MPYREQLLSRVGGPKRYPEPDWDAIGAVTEVWVPENGERVNVGWAVFQAPDRIAWLSICGPESYPYEMRKLVEEILARGAADGVPAEDAWADVLRRTLHTTPQDLYLRPFLADLGEIWNP